MLNIAVAIVVAAPSVAVGATVSDASAAVALDIVVVAGADHKFGCVVVCGAGARLKIDAGAEPPAAPEFGVIGVKARTGLPGASAETDLLHQQEEPWEAARTSASACWWAPSALSRTPGQTCRRCPQNAGLRRPMSRHAQTHAAPPRRLE